MLKNKHWLLLIILSFVFANLIFLNFYQDVWWDSSVYIGMGKYIFSLGKSGLWEESRPLILPIILGFGWKLGFEPISFARVISVIFSILTISMVYLLGSRLFSEKIGLMASFFTAFSYTFLFFSPNILTDIPSTFFLFLAFYFFIESKFFLMGLFAGISVMTRFFQAFTLAGLAIAFFFYFVGKPSFNKKLLQSVLGFLILVAPYLLLNYYLYNNIFLPFQIQGHLTKTTGWMLYQENTFYLTGLLKENFFFISLILLHFFFKKNYKFLALVLTPLFYIGIFSFIKHKEMRFMILVMPFLYLAASYCISQFYSKIRNKKAALEFFCILTVLWLILTFVSFESIVAYNHQRDDEALLHLQNYIKDKHGKIWLTSPLYALYSDSKIDGLLYFYSSENLIKFVQNRKDVDIVLFNNCDIPCYPRDSLCGESREVLGKALSKLKIIHEKKIDSCRYLIYTIP